MYLLQTQGMVTVRDIAEKLDVSIRTVHRDLKGVEKILYHHHLELEKRAGVGLRIIGDEVDKQHLQQTLSYAAVPKDYTQEERQALILSILLEAKEPVKLIALANELDVSVATVSNDLDQMEEALTRFHLTLIRKRGSGVEVVGDEVDKRSAITYLISKYMDPYVFTSLLKENIQNKAVPILSNRFMGLLDPEKLQVIEETVQQASTELPYTLADSAYVGLVVHLALALERLQKGEAIQFDQASFEQIKGTKEFFIAEKIINELKIALDIAIPKDEIGYITMHLMGAKLREDRHLLLEAEDSGFTYQVKQLIANVSEAVQVDITSNSSLLNDLVTHLKPAMYRMQHRMKITNPLIDEIKQDYPDLFELIAEAVAAIFPELDFPDDEIGFLVLHFAAALIKNKNLKTLVVCSSGIGTAKMLATNLTRCVPEITQIENKSMFDVQKSDLDRYDVIISTVPLRALDPSDYILTSPMLNQTEVSRIKKNVRTKNVYREQKQQKKSPDALLQLKTAKHYTDTILALLDAFYIEKVFGTDAPLEIICMDLEKRKRIRNSESILQKLQAREKVGGLGIPNTSLVLYHTRSEAVRSLHFSIYSLSKAISVKGMDEEEMEVTTVLMMLAPETIDQAGLDVLSYLSSLLIQEEKAVALFESADEEAIKQYLAERFQTFLKDKKLL